MKKYFVVTILALISGFSLLAQEIDIKDMRNHIWKETDSVVFEFSCLPTVKPGVIPQDDLYYYWYDGKAIHETKGSYAGWLFDGYFKELNKSGRIIKQGCFRNGLKNGIWKEWWENGSLGSVYEWDNGIKEGELINYDSYGNILNAETYKNGQLNGPALYYQEDSLIIEKIYKKGALVREAIIHINEAD